MKKILLLIFSVFLLVGCNNKETQNKEDNPNDITPQIIDNLKEPILEWCQLYNPNGFNTITCILSNPNNVDIDVTYDLVYYKDDKEVARSEYFTNFSVSPKHKDVIWANYDIPESSKVDEVKMENIKAYESSHKSIDAEIKHAYTKDGYEYFSIKHEKTPELSTVTFFLYNDTNKNNKCDKGELVVIITDSTSEKEDILSFATDGYNYTNYEIYYNAY